MRWNAWMRQAHRWLSPVFTVVVLINLVQVMGRHYSNAMGLTAVAVLLLMFLTGAWLFVLPWAARWRGRG